MLELINLFSKILSGEPLPAELQQQIDQITDRFAKTVAAQVVDDIKGISDVENTGPEPP